MPFDAEVQAYIRMCSQGDGTGQEDIPAMRAAYETLRAGLRGARPEGLRVTETVLADRPARVYVPPGAQEGRRRVLFFHGGGYVLGSLDSHDDLCARLALRAGCSVTALDYRLVPEHPFPAAWEDAERAAIAMSEDGPVILVGDSAGGNLAASVALSLRGTGRIAAQVLAYPDLGGIEKGLPSYTEKAGAALLTTADMRWYRGLTGADAQDVRFSPLLAPDVSGIAPCIAFAAGEDPLRDDAVAWAERLRAAGVEARAVIEDDLPHSYLFARPISKRAAAAFERLCGAVEESIKKTRSEPGLLGVGGKKMCRVSYGLTVQIGEPQP